MLYRHEDNGNIRRNEKMIESKDIQEIYDLLEGVDEVVDLEDLARYCKARKGIPENRVVVWFAKEKLKGNIKSVIAGSQCFLLRKGISLT